MLASFYYQIIGNRNAYVVAKFDLDKVADVRYGAKVHYTVAVGRIDGAMETLYAWRDYASTGEQKTNLVGRQISVMYNSKASELSYAGRDLRVLSMQQFAKANERFVEALALAGTSPAIWVAFLYWRKRQLNNCAPSVSSGHSSPK